MLLMSHMFSVGNKIRQAKKKKRKSTDNAAIHTGLYSFKIFSYNITQMTISQYIYCYLRYLSNQLSLNLDSF